MRLRGVTSTTLPAENPTTYCAVDIETTGLHVWQADVIEVAAVRCAAGAPTGETFVSLARPRIPIPADATAVHGLRDEDVAGAPTISEVMAGFADFVAGETLVVHNAPFDIPFLSRELRCAGVELACPVVDTLQIARSISSRGSNSLGPLCARHGITINHRHRGAGDAEATGKLLWTLLAAGGADPDAALAAARRTTLEPMRYDDLAHLAHVASIVEACPPGVTVNLRYRTPKSAGPGDHLLTVEFYSRSANQVYLTGLHHHAGMERRSYRLDRVEDWSPAVAP